MDSRIIEYLVHNLTQGTQYICRGRKELLSYAKRIGCTIDKNKLPIIHRSKLPNDGELKMESAETYDQYCVEELAKWEK